MSFNVPLNLSSSSSRNGKKYNIAPEFAKSPYLSKPIGSFDPEKHRRSRSPGKSIKQGDSDSESLASLKSHRSAKSQRSQQSYRASSAAGRNVPMKSFLLPREMDIILREFRQKNCNHPILRSQAVGQLDHEDDNSTIASDFAECLDDKAVYSHCRKEQTLQDSLFSGTIFAELTFRNATKEKSGVPIGPTLLLPPVDRFDREQTSGEVSDLDSPEGQARRKKR